MITILVVEDSIKDRICYERVLSNLKEVEYFFANSGEEALEMAKKVHIDLFILDVELPGMSGFELASTLRRMEIYTLAMIIFITGYSKEQLEAFKRFHCYDYILKPFNELEFKEKVVKLIKQMNIQMLKQDKMKIIFFETAEGIQLIPTNKIKYAVTELRKCHLYTELQTEPFISSSVFLKDLIEEVNETYFIQCHKSFAVNVKHIKSIEQLTYRLWKITLFNSETEVDVGKKFYDQVALKLEEWIEEQRRSK